MYLTMNLCSRTSIYLHSLPIVNNSSENSWKRSGWCEWAHIISQRVRLFPHLLNSSLCPFSFLNQALLSAKILSELQESRAAILVQTDWQSLAYSGTATNTWGHGTACRYGQARGELLSGKVSLVYIKNFTLPLSTRKVRSSIKNDL